METFFIYFIKVSVLVSLFYLSYHFLLKRETFFNKSRLFLLVGLITSVILPIITITKTVWIKPVQPVVLEKPFYISDFSDEIVMNTIATEEQKTEINWILIIGGFYVLGMLFFLVKFILSSLSLYKILHKNPIQKQNGFRFIDSKNVKTPFSFFNYIAFDSSSFSEEELLNIINHEKVHSKEKHSFDIILSELFSIVFWINPFVWLYKKAIQQNLEFIADNTAIQTSVNKIGYQKTLLKVTLNPKELALANSFYQPLIKKRIMMLNKIKSKNSQLWKFLVVIPMLVVFVMQFQTKVIAQEKEQQYKLPTSVKWESANENLILPDTIVWVKDFSKAYEDKMLENHPDENQIKKSSVINNDEKEIISFLKSAKDYNKIEIYNRYGNLVYAQRSNEKVDKEKIKSLSDGTYYYVIHKEKGKDETGYLYKGDSSSKNIKTNVEKQETEPEPKEIISFLKSAKDFTQIDVFNRWGKLAYSLKSNEKVDEDKLATLEKGTYFYALQKKSEENQYGYLYKDEYIEIVPPKNEKTNFVITKLDTNSKEDRANPFEISTYKVSSPSDIKNDILNNTEIDYKKAIIIINDKEISHKEFENLEPNKIRSVSEMKGANYLVKIYGEKALNGVIKIETHDYKIEEYKKELEDVRKMTRSEGYKLLNEDNDGFIIHKTSKESDFSFYKSELKKIGIEMKTSNIKRNKNGEITKIKISLSESSGTKDNKKESKAEATFDKNESIPNIFIGKRNGSLIVSSDSK